MSATTERENKTQLLPLAMFLLLSHVQLICVNVKDMFINVNLLVYVPLFVCVQRHFYCFIRKTMFEEKRIYNIVEQPKWRKLLIIMLIDNTIELNVWIKYGVKYCTDIISSFKNGFN